MKQNRKCLDRSFLLFQSMAWMTKIISTMILGAIYLTISDCIIHIVQHFVPVDDYPWRLAFKNAVSFRTSHYFISYFAEASAIAAGFGYVESVGSNGMFTEWKLSVSEPFTVELPRSLVEVVVSWNKPMHRWLKKYCFKKVIRFGKGTAIMATFIASSILHGLNFQVGAILLSLGFFVYVEDKLRNELARRFDASIRTRIRPEIDNFLHNELSFTASFINSIFTMLNVLHLAYLGGIFDQHDMQMEGYDWTHTIAKWQTLGFFSHWFMFVAYLLSLIL